MEKLKSFQVSPFVEKTKCIRKLEVQVVGSLEILAKHTPATGNLSSPRLVLDGGKG